MFDYETIRLIWWLFIGVVAIAFALTEGFDFGAGTLLPFVGKTDLERRVILNTVGGTWEGNQVWLVLLGAPFLRFGLPFTRHYFRAYTSQ